MKIILLLAALVLSSMPVNAVTQEEERIYWYGFTYGFSAALCGQVQQGLSKEAAQQALDAFIENFIEDEDTKKHEVMIRGLYQDLKNDETLCKGVFK
jgi:predicted RNase H-like HicB family nuclease|tara:strand:- start:573 stop:863 length:291 start_codon:yes stop_codon:yes gene_type:complete